MDKLKMQTSNKADENFTKLAQLFPNAVTETIAENGEVVRAIDKDVLMQEISTVVVEETEERYQFTWPDKKKSVLLANASISKTLRPCREESVDFDNTENLYIEGDNLEVLKLLQETYLGKIKMIYIDPPYNTGNDFVYNDDFAQSTDEYIENSGQFDEDGNRLVKNLESNGRFHTDWLNMIYPRLKVAKDLLTDDGVIFISIDENEVNTLKNICDETFGRSNFVAGLIWAAGRKNDSKYISISHEYILCYFKNFNYMKENKIIWRERKLGLDDIYSEYESLREKYKDNYDEITKGLKLWFKNLSDGHPAKAHAHYNLGDLYYKQDKLGLAEHYWKLAADKEYTNAQNNLGALYYEQEKMKQAEHYLKLAADSGNLDSQYNLGLLYGHQGKFKQAEQYWELAADKGHLDAKANLEVLRRK